MPHKRRAGAIQLLEADSLCRSIGRLAAQLRFIEHLNDDLVGIGAIEGGAAVAMNFEWMDNGNAGGTELLFELFDPLDTFDDEAEMVEVLLRCYRGKAGGYLMQSDVVGAG